MMLLSRARARRAVRRIPSEDGFTIVEFMIAAVILGTALFVISQVTGALLIGTLNTRLRESAVALVNRQVEQVRSNGWANILLKPGTTPPPPATYLDTDSAIPYVTLIGTAPCTACLVYSQSANSGTFTYNVLTIVIGVDDAGDGLGAVDSDHITVDYKRVIVQIDSTVGPAFHYKTETIIHDTSKDPAVAVQGLRVEIRDPTDSNQIVTSPDYDWSLSIAAAGILGEDIEEGTYNNYGLLPGTYTCQIDITSTSADWYPQGSPTATSETFTCVIQAGQVTTVPRYWIQRNVCLVDATKAGRLWVKVQDQTGANLANASVDPTPTGGQLVDPLPLPTGSNGEVVFPAVLIGPYNVSVSAVGYQTVSGLGACVNVTDPAGPQVTTSLQPPPPPATTAQVNVGVTFTAKGTWTFVVALENGPQPYSQSQSISQNQTITFSFSPAFGTYNLRVYCVNKSNQNLKNQALAQTYSVTTPPYAYSYSFSSC